MPKDSDGKPEIHYTTIYKVFAKWTDDGSIATAFIASVGHLSEQNQLDLTVLHGDGTNTVAKKAAMASVIRVKWLRVLDAAESPQIDEGVHHQLHPVMPTLEMLKSHQEPLEFVLPCKGPFHPIA